MRGSFKWLGIVTVVAIAAVGAWWVLAERGAVPAPAPITIAAPAQPVAVGADGCLGGADPHTAILAAHDSAALDTFGAAGFARTFIRWISAVPSDPQAAVVVPLVTVNADTANQVAASMTAYNSRVLTAGDTRSGVIPGGTDDVYRIVNADPAGASITVTVVTHQQSTLPDGSHTPELRSIATVILDVINGKWVAAGSQLQGTDPYAAIPGVPFVPFAGAC